MPIFSGFVLKIHLLFESKGFWWQCVILGITCSPDFVRRSKSKC
jgi:hypothetical protein